jgi:hypothetical protein
MEALHKDGEDGDHHKIGGILGGVHGGAMAMENTMISKVILFTI